MKYSKITISGRICTGKTTLFNNLRQKLEWPVFSTSQYFRNLSQTKKLSLENAEEQNEKITKQVDFKVRDLLKSSGNLIAEGWMTGIMANGYPGILKILLTARDETRVLRFSQREKISLQEAEKRIFSRESNLFAKLSKIYNRTDFLDPKNYNLIIDTTNLKPSEVLLQLLNKI